VYAKDIALYLVGTFGVGGFTDRVIWRRRCLE
jgi:homoaconitase/3-isopropylmalate dehydratase large subunit